MLPNDFEDRNVVVIGLGYVGLTLGVYLSELGFKVHGVEIRKLVLDSLEQKKSFFWEPKLDDLLARNLDRRSFTFSQEIPKTHEKRVFIITVGTPVDENRKAIIESILTVSKEVSSALNHGDMVILRSTVKLNTTTLLVRPILEESGKDFDLAFCPERTLEGAALAELGTLPQIVGASSKRSKLRASDFFQQVTPNVVNVSNIETAEMVKLVDNMQRDVFFAISNEVAHLCNSQEIRATEVISAGKLGYKRTNLANPGPVGGPCLEKDSYLLSESVEESGGVARIALAARATNENVIAEASAFISNWLDKNGVHSGVKIVILGMAFKGIPETNDLRGSPSVSLINILSNKIEKSKIYCWDPVISSIELELLGLKSSESLVDLLDNASAIVLMNNHPFLDNLDLTSLLNSSNGTLLVYDFWGRNDSNLSLTANQNYHSWGNHSKAAFRIGQ